jgi:hypothetical protein
LSPFGELTFPFDPALQGKDLTGVPIVRTAHGPLIEETYVIDRHGLVHVTITDLDTGHRESLDLRTG